MSGDANIWVYFITDNQPADGERGTLNVKIGFSKRPLRRLTELQTGNRRKLSIMGTINGGKHLETSLHRYFSARRIDDSEWFELSPGEVLTTLKDHSTDAFLTVDKYGYELLGFGNDGVPEYASPWNWGDIEPDQFCPACGWGGGLSVNGNWNHARCLKCGAS